jgi:hypothetical protein
MSSSLRTIDLTALAGVTGGAGKVVVSGVNYPSTSIVINGVSVSPDSSGTAAVEIDRKSGAVTINQGSGNSTIISR